MAKQRSGPVHAPHSKMMQAGRIQYVPGARGPTVGVDHHSGSPASKGGGHLVAFRIPLHPPQPPRYHAH